MQNSVHFCATYILCQDCSFSNLHHNKNIKISTPASPILSIILYKPWGNNVINLDAYIRGSLFCLANDVIRL